MKTMLPDDTERLMLDQADVALVLVDPADDRIVQCNAVWPQWLGLEMEQVLNAKFAVADWWPEPQVVRTLVSLASLPLAMRAMALRARDAQGQVLPLQAWCKPLQQAQRRHVLFTLVRNQSGVHEIDADALAGQAFKAVVQTLGAVLEGHDPASVGHQQRVAELAVTLARKLNWPQAEVQSIEQAALLHDLGMITVPSDVLAKHDQLTFNEIWVIQQHVEAGMRMLEHIDFPGPVIALIAQHHERLNGTGYPLGLKGEAILRGAQLIGMADVLDAMTRERPYQPAQTMAQALESLSASAGVLFDAELVHACVDLFVQDGYRFPQV